MDPSPPERPELSPSERALLVMMANGLKEREMAERFQIRRHSLATKKTRLYRKLDARNGPHAVALGFRFGYLSVRKETNDQTARRT